MSTFNFKTEQFLHVDIGTAWDFFSSAKNLALITPPEMDFKILTNLDDKEIYEGMIIDYTVKPLLGIPIKWQTEIVRVNKPFSFTDRQVKGPYKLWEHTHTYIQQESGILMIDEVKYQLSFGVLDSLINNIIIKNKIKNIFAFRKDVLTKMFIINEHTVS